MGGLDRDREGHRSRADVPPSKKEARRWPTIRLISKKIGCCLPQRGFPQKSLHRRRLAIVFPQKVCKINDVQFASIKKVSAVDGLQLASLKKFLLLTTCNWLPSKSFCCRRLTIGFPRKVSAVYGLQSAYPKKFSLSTAYNRLPPKSKHCRRLTMGFPKKGCTVDGLQRPSGTGEKWAADRRRASRKVIWPERGRRCGKWRGRPSGDGEQCGARRSS